MLMQCEFDTWVDRGLDLATVRDDHYPTVLEVTWRAVAVKQSAQWHVPVMHRPDIVEGPSAEMLRHSLPLVALPSASTPVDLLHAFVARLLQSHGALFFAHSAQGPRPCVDIG